MKQLAFFKAYDIRGKVPDELNSAMAKKIGIAFAKVLKPLKVVVGYDIRLSSPELAQSLIEGLLISGVDVINIGLCGTENIYFATSYLKCDGGIMITASHNPIDYNGMKMVKKNSYPITGETELGEIKKLIETDDLKIDKPIEKGTLAEMDISDAYIKHILSFINIENIRKMKIVSNTGNGSAYPWMKKIEKFLPVEFVHILSEPDGNFPNGIPNPLLPENREITTDSLLKYNGDFAIAFDGDFDRCFFFDEKGRFIEGYYMVALFSEHLLKNNPKEKIIFDPRLYWNTVEVIEKNGGIPVMSKTGHAFIKERMRKENAIYGGEMSAHHYFRDFFYCDSGMIPWLILLEKLSLSNKKLSQLVDEMIEKYPVSGEINLKVENSGKVIRKIEEKYAQNATKIIKIDGLSVEFEDWRFNLRSSNTEPLLRLNVESRNNYDLMIEKRDEILNIIKESSSSR